MNDETERDLLAERDDDLGDELAARADETEAFAAIDFEHEQRRI